MLGSDGGLHHGEDVEGLVAHEAEADLGDPDADGEGRHGVALVGHRQAELAVAAACECERTERVNGRLRSSGLVHPFAGKLRVIPHRNL